MRLLTIPGVTLVWAAGCGTRSVQPSAHFTPGPGGHTDAAGWGVDGGPAPGTVDPRAFGKGDLSKLVFAAFSQTAVNGSDPQVLDLAPDLVLRAWAKWDRSGTSSSDYNFAYPTQCRAKGVTFLGGTTASVLFRDELSAADFEMQVGRNAAGLATAHPEVVQGAYRGTLASPAFRQRLVDVGKLQIDGGVDGLFYDEVNGGYAGPKFDRNEGFDDAQVADFGNYLCRKYTTIRAVWGTVPEDKLDCTGPLEAQGRSFDYRGYLARHGAQATPLGPANPLNGEWGRTVPNRPDPSGGTFVEVYPSLVYWQEIVVALRTYARQKYQREVLVTANGIFPFVDFQSVGLYDWNNDGPGPKGVDYVPASNGHLDGQTSLATAFAGLRARSHRITAAVGGSDVPLVLFIDWPTDTITRYYSFTLQERKDYFRIFGAEAYANGLFFAFPLRTTTDGNTAQALSMTPFFAGLRDFYRAHADLYRGARLGSSTPVVTSPLTFARLSELSDGRAVVHLVNHNYVNGVVRQTGVHVTWPSSHAPTSIALASPDFASDKTASFSFANGLVALDVGDLDAYVVAVVRWRSERGPKR